MPVAFLSRTEHQCAWLISDRTCCGAEVYKKSYCLEHYNASYKPPRGAVHAVPERSYGHSINRHDHRTLVHGGKAQRYGVEE